MYIAHTVCTAVKVEYRIASNYGPGIYFFQQLFTPATKQDRRLYETGVY